METDLLLLDAARKLDKQALVSIFDQYAAPLYNYAVRLCSDPSLANHIVGDVFAQLLEQLAAGKGPTHYLRSYLYESVYHRIIDETRYAQRRAPLEVLLTERADVQSTMVAAEDKILLDAVMDVVKHDRSADQRDVIILRFLEEFSLRETADILGKEISHVKVIQSRALARLRQALESREITTKPRMSRPRLRKLSKALGL